MKLRDALAAGLFLAATSHSGYAQGPVWIPPPPAGPTADTRRAMEARETSVELEHHLDKVRQSDRQRRMIADTRRLLTLATELKAATGKSAKETPPGDVIKKADEIEKLARSVKDRMKG